ncbi:phosphate--AMP phosphotransferase [Staphylococcus pasteuri]|uniref:phosphate--AMP phosphotransferase n=1 Tax=Staphylococcus pasteuri TaxID=45972 RepID=UPI003261CB2B
MNKKIEELKLKAASLTRQTHELGIPIMILFEGMPASGKTRLSNELLLTFDAKYTQFISTKSPQYEDLRYQFLQKYWNTLPQKGHINIYFRSWYSHFLDYKENSIKQAYYKKSEKLVNQIKSFETMLQNDNYELIKFYIEVSEEKRQEHIQQTKDNLLMKWKVQEYEQVIPNETYLAEMRKFTHKDNQWEVIDYTQREVAFEKMYKHIIERLENAIKKSKRQQANKDGAFSKDFSTNMFDVKFEKISKKEYKEMIEPLQKRMREIQFALYERKIPLILTFEGMDAAGKGGNIKRIREKLDPTGYEVNGISAPTDVELAHHYLWRFAKEMPKTGHLEIFDRSWYGRVLVERVEGFADKEEWKRAYHEINEFEKMWTDEGAILLKFFLCLDKDEQLKRFKDREQDPNKQWKITDEDWRNRDKWDLYLEASHDMIKQTDTNYASWFIVPADHKKTARVEVLKYIIRQCEKVLWGVKDY